MLCFLLHNNLSVCEIILSLPLGVISGKAGTFSFPHLSSKFETIPRYSSNYLLNN